MALTPSAVMEWVRRVAATSRIGIDLAPGPDGALTARAVGARGTHVEWQREGSLDQDEPLAVALSAWLTTLPRRRRWPRPEAIIALGGPSVQIKRLAGLPQLADARALTAAVRENASRFFLRNGIPITTSSLRIDAPGDAWGAATERPLLESIEIACNSARLRLRAIVPATAVVGTGILCRQATTAAVHAAAGVASGRAGKTQAVAGSGEPATTTPATTTIVWPSRDHAAAQSLAYTGNRLIGIRRLAPLVGAVAGAVAGESIVPHDGEPWPFAAAYGAAISGLSEPIAWRPTLSAPPVTSMLRLRTAAILATASVLIALASPGLVAMRESATATHHLHVVALERQEALRAADALAEASTALRETGTFARTHHSVTALLANISRLLPPQSAIVAFHSDSGGGTLVALTSSASALLSGLERVPGLAALELVGPVTTEPVVITPVAGQPSPPTPHALDRVTVRFRLGVSSPAGAAP